MLLINYVCLEHIEKGNFLTFNNQCQKHTYTHRTGSCGFKANWGIEEEGADSGLGRVGNEFLKEN